MLQKPKGSLIVISGPSGVGKGTIVKAILNRVENITLSVSATTRAIRPGEREGVNYFYISDAEFDRMIGADEFLEYTDVFGMNRYGTPRSYVESSLAKGLDVILEIDVNGAMNVKRAMDDAVMVFIAPPSMTELRARLEKRGTETREAIERRYATAKLEIGYIEQYDYVVVNDELEKAIAETAGIILAERRRVGRCARFWESYKEER